MKTPKITLKANLVLMENEEDCFISRRSLLDAIEELLGLEMSNDYRLTALMFIIAGDATRSKFTLDKVNTLCLRNTLKELRKRESAARAGFWKGATNRKEQSER